MLGGFVNSRDDVQVGKMFNTPGGNGMGISLFNDQASAIAVGDVVLVGYDPDGNNGLLEGMQALAPATMAFVVYTAICIKACAVDKVGYFQLSGVVDAYVKGDTDVAKGDFVEVLNGTNEYILDGTARTTVSSAMALAASTDAGNNLTSIYKIGEPHTIAAS